MQFIFVIFDIFSNDFRAPLHVVPKLGRIVVVDQLADGEESVHDGGQLHVVLQVSIVTKKLIAGRDIFDEKDGPKMYLSLRKLF